MVASLKHENFAAQLNTKFRVQDNDGNGVDLVLSEVSELKTSPTQEQFSIVFRGPLSVFLGQGGRQFEHDQMGHFELFIVPIGKDDSSFLYEAVFNRLRK
jgi:hypothetical protein